MIVSLVAAMAENRVIGHSGGLPWHLPKDLQFFKKLTVDHTVIMGRRTFDEVKRPLSNRRNVVITRNLSFRPHGVTVVPSLEEALALGATEDEVREAISFAIRANAAKAHADILSVWTESG